MITTLEEALAVIAELRAELDEHTSVCPRAGCGKRFPLVGRQRFCSVSCGRLARGSYRDTAGAVRTCALPGCDEIFQLRVPSDPKKFCSHEHASAYKTKAPEERAPRKPRGKKPRPPRPVRSLPPRAPVPELPPAPPPVERPVWRPAGWGPLPPLGQGSAS